LVALHPGLSHQFAGVHDVTRTDTPDKLSPSGRIDIAESAIVSIVESAVLSCYGIVDMAPKSMRALIGRKLSRGKARRGIGVNVLNGHVSIELSVIMEYGTPILTFARNVMKTVKFQVERTLGMPVDRVDINIQGLRVSQNQARSRA
jgi:uncharacterized alkaline shock family protein YloU